MNILKDKYPKKGICKIDIIYHTYLNYPYKWYENCEFMGFLFEICRNG